MQVDHTKKIVEVENVSFSYGKEKVLSHINLEIHPGDYLGLVGENGSGKTTLLKIMLGLIAPDSGSVRLFGTDIKDFKERSKIGYVPQKATNFDSHFPATVEEVALMGTYGKRGLLHRVTEKDRASAKTALSQVGMLEYKDRLVGELSGGEQQRVFIARSLAGAPEIIFLDEPTTGVDAETQKEFYALLKKLNQELDLTLVLVSHDIARVVGEVMHIACVDCTLAFHSSPQEFFKETETRRINGENVKIISHHHV